MFFASITRLKNHIHTADISDITSCLTVGGRKKKECKEVEVENKVQMKAVRNDNVDCE